MHGACSEGDFSTIFFFFYCMQVSRPSRRLIVFTNFGINKLLSLAFWNFSSLKYVWSLQGGQIYFHGVIFFVKATDLRLQAFKAAKPKCNSFQCF